jgi:hypothetical protein
MLVAVRLRCGRTMHVGDAREHALQITPVAASVAAVAAEQRQPSRCNFAMAISSVRGENHVVDVRFAIQK